MAYSEPRGKPAILTLLGSSGADPRRILLLTFSRRAARDTIPRVERIAAEAMGTSGTISSAIEWAGTFHAVGASSECTNGIRVRPVGSVGGDRRHDGFRAAHRRRGSIRFWYAIGPQPVTKRLGAVRPC
jgi:hypothetical protein